MVDDVHAKGETGGGGDAVTDVAEADDAEGVGGGVVGDLGNGGVGGGEGFGGVGAGGQEGGGEMGEGAEDVEEAVVGDGFGGGVRAVAVEDSFWSVKKVGGEEKEGTYLLRTGYQCLPNRSRRPPRP